MLLLFSGKINPHCSNVDAVVGIGNQSRFVFSRCFIGNDGLGILEGGCSWQDNKIIFVKGKKRSGAAKDIISTIKQSVLFNVELVFRLGYIYLFKVGKAVLEREMVSSY